MTNHRREKLKIKYFPGKRKCTLVSNSFFF